MSNSRSEASRINGRASVGPISEEGKATSSKNALKHGLFSKRRFLSDENPAEFEALLNAYAEEHNPATVVEWAAVDRMAMARWRLARFERAEAAQAELERNRFLFAQENEKWERYGGRGLIVRLSQASSETLAAVSKERDALVTAALSIPSDPEKYVRLASALNREFESALRLLREEQSRRIGRMELQRSAPKSSRATEGADIVDVPLDGVSSAPSD
jgi:hypothetical protein